MDRQGMLDALNRARRSGTPFWGIGVSDQTLSPAVRAGASWVVANHTAAFKYECPATVVGLLPFADANDAVIALGASMKADIPVLAAAYAGDQFRTTPQLLKDLKTAGYAGLTNFPTVCVAGGKFKEFLEASEMGYDCEVGLIRAAAKEGFFTAAVVFAPEHGERMALAGADMLIYHPGLNADGDHRGWNARVRESFTTVRDVAVNIKPEIICCRSSFSLDEWPPEILEAGVGVMYDGNFRPGNM